MGLHFYQLSAYILLSVSLFIVVCRHTLFPHFKFEINMQQFASPFFNFLWKSDTKLVFLISLYLAAYSSSHCRSMSMRINESRWRSDLIIISQAELVIIFSCQQDGYGVHLVIQLFTVRRVSPDTNYHSLEFVNASLERIWGIIDISAATWMAESILPAITSQKKTTRG